MSVIIRTQEESQMTSLTSIRRLATVVSLAALTALGLGTTQAVADNDKTITWRVQSHWPSASSSFTDSLANLRDTLAERTNGRLQLQIHEAGALFPADEIFPAVRRGIIEMGTISPAYIMNRVTTAGIASGLPFAFRNTWEAAY